MGRISMLSVGGIWTLLVFCKGFLFMKLFYKLSIWLLITCCLKSLVFICSS